jgi:hypothetical protein
MLNLKAAAKNQTFREFLDPSLPRLWADERALRQIVLNVLSNAVKFTPQGGEITIKVGWTSSGGQYLSVRDTGPAFRKRRYRSSCPPSDAAPSRSRPRNRLWPGASHRERSGRPAWGRVPAEVEAARGHGGDRHLPGEPG